MRREKATDIADLPHQFEAGQRGRCNLCLMPALDARHVAWEKASLLKMERESFARERGI